MSASFAPTTELSSAKLRQLSNGLSVSVLSQPWLSRAAVCVRVGAGSHDEPLAYPGLAHFIEHMLFLDCAAYRADQRLMPFVQGCGGQVNATTQARHTEYFFEVPDAQLEGALERLIAMLANPLLDETQQRREREVVHAEFEARSQDAQTLLACAFAQAAAVGHRSRDFVAGNRTTLMVEEGAFQHALRSWHQRFYVAANCQLSLVGPGSEEALWSLAERVASVFPAQLPVAAAPSVSLLPLGFHAARVQLPGSPEPAVHVGFALALPAATADDAMALVSTWLMDDQPGTLLAALRNRDGCRRMDVRPVYTEAGHAMLVVSVYGVADAERAMAYLNDWLVFIQRQADIDALLTEHHQARAWRAANDGPVQQARRLTSAAVGHCSPCDALSVRLLLKQMHEPSRQVVMTSLAEHLPVWEEAGFPLRMAVQTRSPVHVPAVAWVPPGANRLLQPDDAVCVMTVPATLRWMSAPAQRAPQPVAQATWLASLSFAKPLGSECLLQLAQHCSQALVRQAEQLGIQVQISSASRSLTLRVQGHAALLRRVVTVLMSALANPDEGSWQAALAAPVSQGQMPIRVLLMRCADMLEPMPQGAMDAAQLRECYATLRVEALGVGFSSKDQQALASVFCQAVQPDQTPLQRAAQPTGFWQQVQAEGEAALLVFCPQPDASAHTEACWRLLALLHQSGFYQRLRSELQLGYAVFCQYRQIQGRRGLLFGVQSPHLGASAILEHIQAFLLARDTWLEELDETTLHDACRALIDQLQPCTVDEVAEQSWQLQLAGLADDHPEQVLVHLRGLQRQHVCAAQRALTQAAGGRFVLSNQQQSA